MPLIEMQDIVKEFVVGDSEVRALDGVSLCIEEQTFTAIIGPSGSGKSTLMNIIGCLDIATGGSYRLQGEDIESLTDNELSEYRTRTIGFIFQKFNLLSKMSALENVELPLVYQGVGSRERRRRAQEALENVGLGDRMKHTPFELSGGQQQRVAIARALVTKPPLILADEPTGNLDSKTGAEVLQVLEGLHRQGNTIVLITHDPNVAARAARVVSIRDGRITKDEEVKRA